MLKGVLKEGCFKPYCQGAFATFYGFGPQLVRFRVVSFYYKIREKRKFLLKAAEFN